MLRDLMSAAGMAGFAEAALLLFFAAFIAIIVWVMRQPRADVRRWASYPLHDDEPEAPHPKPPLGAHDHE